MYQRRHEFAPQIIGGSAVLGGGFFYLRRGRIAGLLGATACGGASYAFVYDQLVLDNVPDHLSEGTSDSANAIKQRAWNEPFDDSRCEKSG